MEIVKNDPHLMVIDNFLGEEQFKAIQLQLMLEQYTQLHEGFWKKAWRLTDGNPLVSAIYNFSSEEHFEKVASQIYYPTNKPFDLFVDALNAVAAKAQSIIGQRDRDWSSYGFRAYIYTVGTGLGWHEDDVSVSGAFVYYCHPHWSMDWGGELLILEKVIPTGIEPPGGSIKLPDNMRSMSTKGAVGPEFGWNSRAHHFMDIGMGQFVSAKPNRLVFIGPHHSHSVRPVTIAAGENPRISLAGFFQK
jgi:Rps23 Pro-64 3,4-dihydroxylase Tpa1-like proline 4-hydroxylase